MSDHNNDALLALSNAYWRAVDPMGLIKQSAEFMDRGMRMNPLVDMTHHVLSDLGMDRTAADQPDTAPNIGRAIQAGFDLQMSFAKIAMDMGMQALQLHPQRPAEIIPFDGFRRTPSGMTVRVA